jgi:hypothetical protein
VYTIFFFIALLSFPPKGRSKNPDLSAPVRESDGHDLAEYFAKVKIPLFIIAVKRSVKDNTLLILECLLRILKRPPVFGDIVQILAIVPFEIRRFHNLNVLRTSLFVNRKTHPRNKEDLPYSHQKMENMVQAILPFDPGYAKGNNSVDFFLDLRIIS